MYNLDVTSIIRYMIVPNGDIRKNNMTYMDMVTDVQVTNNSTYPSSMGIKLSLKELNKENVKLFTVNRLDELFIEILDKYYELYKRDWDKEETVLIEDVEDNPDELLYRVTQADRLIASETRYGLSTVIIVPDEKYFKLINSNGKKIIVNKTNFHKDKIFLIRVNSDNSSPGLTLFVDRDIIGGRYLKITKLLSKIRKTTYDLPFNYCISEVGTNIGKYVKIIKLI